MENAVFGFMGALIGAVLGFIGSLFSTFGKSKDSSKEVLTRTVTNERAQWRKELRQASADFVESALRVAANEVDGSVFTLQRQRVQIRLRLNPNPKHKLDANIITITREIAQNVTELNTVELARLLDDFEANIQSLLKQEWEKSKREAVTGNLEINNHQEREEK